MVNSMLFIAVAVAAALLAPLNADAACSCLPDFVDTINGTAIGHSITVIPPTSNGNYTGDSCATNCSTTIAYFGHITEGKLLGASITVMTPSGLNGNNYINFYGGNTLVQTIASDADAAFNIQNSNVTIEFILTVPVTVYIFSSPIDREAPASTTPSPATTPVYNGSYPVNPDLVRLDLIIGIDASQAGFDSFKNAKDTIKELVNTFSYSDDSVRLSLFRFTPSEVLPYGFFELPWTHNANSFATSLDSIVPYAGTTSDYFGQLNNGLFRAINGGFPFRENTERVLLIFTATDATPNGDELTKAEGSIKATDLRVVLAITNSSLPTTAAYFGQIQSISTLTYQFGANSVVQVENLLEQTIFNGNALSKLENKINNPDQVSGIAILDSVPPTGFTYYTTFTNYAHRYIRSGGLNQLIKLTITEFETTYNKDFIIISVDGEEVARLTGLYGYAPYFCLAPKTDVTVTFTSSYGKVYRGFNSTAVAADNTTCPTPPGTGFLKSGKIMKYIKTSDVSTYLGSPQY